MAEEPTPSAPVPEPSKGAPAPADDFVTKLRAALPALLDELLGPEEKELPASAPVRQTQRQREDSVRDEVARAVADLEAKARQVPGTPSTPSPPTPPQPEVKPWREKFWG